MTLVATLISITWILGIVGWVANIYHLCISFTTVGDLVLFQFIQLIGIFFGPLGVVTGWIAVLT